MILRNLDLLKLNNGTFLAIKQPLSNAIKSTILSRQIQGCTNSQYVMIVHLVADTKFGMPTPYPNVFLKTPSLERLQPKAKNFFQIMK